MRSLLFISVTLFVLSTVAETHHRTIEYGDIHSMLTLVKTKAQSPLVNGEVYVSINNPDIKREMVRIELSRGDKTLFSPQIQANGKLELPLFDQAEAQGVLLSINQTKDDVTLSFSIGIKKLEQLEMRYHHLFVVLDDIDLLTSEMAGIAGWFAPSMDALKFTFDAPSTIEVRSEMNSQIYYTNRQLQITINRSDTLMKDNPTVLFSVLPKSVTPED